MRSRAHIELLHILRAGYSAAVPTAIGQTGLAIDLKVFSKRVAIDLVRFRVRAVTKIVHGQDVILIHVVDQMSRAIYAHLEHHGVAVAHLAVHLRAEFRNLAPIDRRVGVALRADVFDHQRFHLFMTKYGADAAAAGLFQAHELAPHVVETEIQAAHTRMLRAGARRDYCHAAFFIGGIAVHRSQLLRENVAVHRFIRRFYDLD